MSQNGHADQVRHMLRTKQILILEHDDATREQLHAILEPLGYAVLDVERAKAPAQAIADRAIDLVITDFFMAGAFAAGDGTTWSVQEIRKRQESVRVLALSGAWRRSAEPAAEAALRIGADLVIGKPVERTELAKAVLALIGGPLDIG